MHSRSSPKDALIPLLSEYCSRIGAMEAEIELWVAANDYRPRIERFHDAVRAYTQGISPHEPYTRLSIEQLAWDVDMLRRIQSKPLMPMPGSTPRQGISTDLTVIRPNAVGDVGNARASARQFKTDIASGYKNYAVMFTALLAETADMNHASRMEDKDMQVEELAVLRASMGKKPVNLEKSISAQVFDPDIRAQINALLPKGTLSSPEALEAINSAMARIDAQQSKLENAHLNWLSGQNMMYQQGKEVVQQMMQNGLNLAGKFLQEAMQQGAGRGRGM